MLGAIKQFDKMGSLLKKPKDNTTGISTKQTNGQTSTMNAEADSMSGQTSTTSRQTNGRASTAIG